MQACRQSGRSTTGRRESEHHIFIGSTGDTTCVYTKTICLLKARWPQYTNAVLSLEIFRPSPMLTDGGGSLTNKEA